MTTYKVYDLYGLYDMTYEICMIYKTYKLQEITPFREF